MTQKVIGQNDGGHGFAHRHTTNTNARVMATLGDDIDFLAVNLRGVRIELVGLTAKRMTTS